MRSNTEDLIVAGSLGLNSNSFDSKCAPFIANGTTTPCYGVDGCHKSILCMSALSCQQGVSEEDDYVIYLKGQVDKLANEVRTLKSRAAYGGGRRGSLRELRVT
jgi:hypothetical protein